MIQIHNPILDISCILILPYRSHMLQADSEEMLQCWISAMQKGIGAALQQSLSQDGNGQDGGNSGSDSVKSHSPSGSSASDLPDKSSPDKPRKAR